MVAQNSSRAVKRIAGTNIVAKRLEDRSSDANEEKVRLLRLLQSDDPREMAWLAQQRPEPRLQNAAEAFLQGVKKLRPAINFNTFDAKKARSTRRRKQEQHEEATKERRAKRITPTVAMKAALNPRRVPGDTALATDVDPLPQPRQSKKKLKKKASAGAATSAPSKKKKLGRTL